MRALMKWILAQNKHWENFSVTQKSFLGDRRTCDLLIPSLDPREWHKPSLVTILGLREDHQTGSWPELQRLDRTFNDAESLHGMVEEQVTCWYHHWIPGSGTDPVWLQFWASEKITKMGTGPNYSAWTELSMTQKSFMG